MPELKEHDETRSADTNDTSASSGEGTPMLLVCDGATCTCTMATNPAPKKIKVISHHKFTLSNTKLLATTKENNTSALNFGTCKVPDPSHPVPCTANLKWINYYEHIHLPGNTYPLTENSKAICLNKGGNIQIIRNGQTAGFKSPDHQTDINKDSFQATNSQSENTPVNNESIEATENTEANITTNPNIREARDENSLPIKDNSYNGKIRKNEVVTFELNKHMDRHPADFWQVVGKGEIVMAGNTSVLVKADTPNTAFSVIAYCNNKRIESATIVVLENKLKSLKLDKQCRTHETIELDSSDYFELPPDVAELNAVCWHCETLPDLNSFRGARIRYSFDMPGTYQLYSYLQTMGKELQVTVFVNRPSLEFASWRDTQGLKKFITGFGETNHLSLTFMHSNNLSVDVTIGAIHETSGKRISLQHYRQRVADDHIGIVFVPDKVKHKEVKDGMKFYAQVKFSNPVYASYQDTILQPAKLLKLKSVPEIVSIKFLKNNKQVYCVGYGETLDGQVYARNLLFSELEIEVYRKELRGNKDWLRKDTRVFNCRTHVNKDGLAFFQFKLQESFRHQYKEEFHTFYVKIKEESWFGAHAMIMAFPELTNSKKGKTSAISQIQKNNKHSKVNQCPACNADITVEEIMDICSDNKGNLLINDLSKIQDAISTLNKFRPIVGLSRCIRKAHFLAQIAEETRFYQLNENFNYSANSLIETFRRFKTAEGRKRAMEWGRSQNNEAPPGIERQTAIANWAYAGINGNSHDYKTGDGWRYKGRGFIQLTGKENYKQVSEYFNKYFNDKKVDWVSNPSLLENDSASAMSSALSFWKKHQLNARADIGISREVVAFVTKPLNTALKNLETRIEFFNRAVKTLRLNNCIHYNARKDQIGSIVVVRGNGHHKIDKYVVYETIVWRNLTLEKYNQLKSTDCLPEPDYITYLSRDAWDTTYLDEVTGDIITVKHDNRRYGSCNEVPPGTYYLFSGTATQKYSMYIGDTPGVSSINGIHGKRDGIAIHHFSPDDSQGCLTLVSGKNREPVSTLYREIPDLTFQSGTRPVRIILEERKVATSTWKKAGNGTTKWMGVLDTGG
ncbi:DUF4280 domain-containing protein [Chitinophaga silvatica]|uniref:DUF4280 domain-containing protein n=1 Tax=Chitinophaga silvatica TaxID=2282649 RepID=A0A3E1YE34_9BACT|nr:PAAR-like protein [Chitinophaga silvatica]RFS24835.1 DUF4280 domain-containing protein [Chitinophaga silvatica]